MMLVKRKLGEVELAIPSVIEKAIEQVLEEECTND